MKANKKRQNFVEKYFFTKEIEFSQATVKQTHDLLGKKNQVLESWKKVRYKIFISLKKRAYPESVNIFNFVAGLTFLTILADSLIHKHIKKCQVQMRSFLKLFVPPSFCFPVFSSSIFSLLDDIEIWFIDSFFFSTLTYILETTTASKKTNK